MARNPDYLIMQGMGGWLEKVLAPKIENWQIKELFREAVDLLDLHYNINYDHPSFKLLEEITARGVGWYDLSYGILEGGQIAKAIVQELKTTISLLSALFKMINRRKQPWEITIKKELLNSSLPSNEEIDSLAKEYFKILAECKPLFKPGCLSKEQAKLLKDKRRSYESALAKLFKFQDARRVDELYSQIGEKLILQEDGIKKVKVLLDVTKDGRITPITITPSDQKLPFRIVASRIFFDFLLMGGQDYFAYCAQCGRFIVAQRKGRRQTCSDACRLQLFHANRS